MKFWGPQTFSSLQYWLIWLILNSHCKTPWGSVSKKGKIKFLKKILKTVLCLGNFNNLQNIVPLKSYFIFNTQGFTLLKLKFLDVFLLWTWYNHSNIFLWLFTSFLWNESGLNVQPISYQLWKTSLSSCIKLYGK